MNWADYTILTVTLISILIGLFRGFTREVLGIVGWVLAFWAAFALADTASIWLEPRIDTPSVRKAVAFGGVFLICLLLSSVATFLAAGAVRESALSGLDRTLGAGFGFLRGLFLVAALLLVASTTSARQDPWWRESALVPHLEWLSEALRAVTPERWIRALESPDSPIGPAAGRQDRTPPAPR